MQVKVLGSSSAGNGYVLKASDSVLLLEAGVPLKKVKEALDFKLRDVVGVFVTHEHGDHYKYADEYTAAGIALHASPGTLDGRVDNYRRPMKTREAWQAERWTVGAFHVRHDAREPYGYWIHHPEAGRILFISDTYLVPYRFHNINHIMIECNYCHKLIEERAEAARRNRVILSHMELESTRAFIRETASPALRSVTLLHLSDAHSDEALFKRLVQEDLDRAGHHATVRVARPGLSFEMTPTIF